MTAIDAQTASPDLARPRRAWERYVHGDHWRSSDEEFDGQKIGMWLFLTTEVLLFSGLFCAYAVFRMLYPDAFANGSHYLDWRWGSLNTLILLLSSYTVAKSINDAQCNRQGLLKINLFITIVCALAFLAIKFTLEYVPKWSVGKRPGSFFDYPFAANEHESIWWSIYYTATGIHAMHVLVGAGLLSWLLWRSFKGFYGPRHYNGLEIVGLYWHIVDIIWIFLFPLLYLIH